MHLRLFAAMALLIACTPSNPDAGVTEPPPPPPAAPPAAPPIVDAGLTPDAGVTVRLDDTPADAPGLIASGHSYRGFMSGPPGRSASGHIEQVIGIRDVGPNLAAGLDVISAAGHAAPVPLTSAAQLGSVVVSRAMPAAVAFVDHVDPQTSLGTVMYARIDGPKPAAIAVPEGARTTQDGLHFGANGNELLMLSQYDEKAASGRLYWWGGQGQPRLIGEFSPTTAAVFSEDGSVAVVGTKYNKETGIGDLSAVNMATGDATPIAQSVALLAPAYQSLDGILSLASEPAYAVSRNGRYVAYAGRDGTVNLWSHGKSVAIGQDGRFPSPSDDGKFVAYYAGKSLKLWSAGKTIAVPAEGAFTPTWAPDGRSVAFLTKYKLKGRHPTLGTVIGDLAVLPVNAKDAIDWATDVAWHSVKFSQKSVLFAYARLHDMTDTATLDGAVGNMVAGSPMHVPTTAVENVRPDAFRELLSSGGVAFTLSEHPFSGLGTYTAGFWTPAQGHVPALLKNAINSTIQVTDGDRCIVLTDPTRTAFLGMFPVAKLQGFVPGKKPFVIRDHVLAAGFARDGRVMVLTEQRGSDTNAELWLLPYAPSK